MKTKAYDKVIVGVIGGIAFPLLTMLVLYFTTYSHLKLTVFVHRMVSMGFFFPILSICALSNLLLFFIFIWTQRNFAAQGVLAATFGYAFLVVIYKFLG